MGLFLEYIYFKIIELSSLSTFEYAQIVGNYKTIDSKDKELEYRERGYSEQQIKLLKKQNKINVFSALDLQFTNVDKVTYPLFGFIITSFMAYNKHGILPFDGPLANQPSKIIEVFEVLEALQIEKETQLRREMEKKNNGKR